MNKIKSKSPPKVSKLVKGFLPIEKYLAEEKRKDPDKVTFLSMENLWL